jgi:HEAT repeat protein
VSNQPVFEFVATPGFGEAAALAEAMLREGRAREFAEQLLDEVGSGVAWRRARALERVCRLDGQEQLVAPLIEALGDAERPSRRNAARSLLAALGAPGQPSSDRVIERLGAEAVRADDTDFRLLAASALGETSNPAAVGVLTELLADEASNVVSAAADALGGIGDGRTVPALGRLATGTDAWRAIAAIVALGRLGDEAALPHLHAAARDELRRSAVANAVGALGSTAGFELLREIESHADGTLRRQVHTAAAKLVSRESGDPVPDWLRRSVQGREQELQKQLLTTTSEEAARLLGIAGTPAAARVLTAAISQPHAEPAAAAGLALLPPEVATPAILDAMPAAQPACRAALLLALPAPREAETADRVAHWLGDEHDVVRTAAAESVARGPDEIVQPVLLAALAHPSRRRGAVIALGRLGAARCDPLAALLDDDDAEVRLAAAEGLARCASAEVAEQVAARLHVETDRRVLRALMHAVAHTRGPTAVEALAGWLRHDEPALRFDAARALGESGDATALPHLLGALDDSDDSVRAAALSALGTLGDPRAGDPLAQRLDEGSRDHRRLAARALASLAPASAVRRLRTALSDEDREVRLAAVRALGVIHDPESEPLLRDLAGSDPDAWVRGAARDALLGFGAAPPDARETQR